MSERVVAGGCFCGGIRFDVTLPTQGSAYCHCSMCRRNHGAGFVAWFRVANDQLKMTEGESKLVRRASSEHGVRSFCSGCGTPLFCQSDHHPESIDVVLASMDTSIDREPQAHIYYTDRADWVKVDDALPKFGGKTGTEPLDLD